MLIRNFCYLFKSPLWLKKNFWEPIMKCLDPCARAHIRPRHCTDLVFAPGCCTHSVWPSSSLRCFPWRWTRAPSCWRRAESSARPATSGSTASRWDSTASSPRSSASWGWNKRPTSAGTWSANCSLRRLLWRSSWTNTTRGWRTKTMPRRRPSSLWQLIVNQPNKRYMIYFTAFCCGFFSERRA